MRDFCLEVLTADAALLAGKVILKNGKILRANFEINTHTFDFLEQDSVVVYIDKSKAWYYMDEQELWDMLGMTREEAIPYMWLPDRPLDYDEEGPYQMTRIS